MSQSIDAPSLLVLGSICIDLAAFSKSPPTAGETIIGDDFALVLGGKGSNQAIAAALAGSKSSLISCIGDDIFSEFAKTSLSSFGVDTSQVLTVSGPTGIAHIRINSSGQNNIVVVPLANSKISKEQIAAAFQQNNLANTLLLQLEVPWELNQTAIELAKARNMRIILDPAPAQSLSENAWKDFDIVTPNESEAAAITGIDPTEIAGAIAAGRWFVDRGVRSAIITMGAAGVVLVEDAGVQHIAAPKVQALDTTAAGDAFAGYLGAMLSQGKPLLEAIKFSVSAASLSVTKVGASSSLPTRQAVEAFIS